MRLISISMLGLCAILSACAHDSDLDRAGPEHEAAEVSERGEELRLARASDYRAWPVHARLPLMEGVCSGMLVAPRWVAYPARCVPYLTTAYAQHFYFRSGPQLGDATYGRISSAWTHPSYDPLTQRHGIALVRLAHVVNLPVAALPTSAEIAALPTGTAIDIVNWDSTSPSHPLLYRSPFEFRTTRQLVRPTAECATFEPGIASSEDGFLCTQPGPTLGYACDEDESTPAVATIGGQVKFVGLFRGPQSCATLPTRQLFISATDADWMRAVIDDVEGGCIRDCEGVRANCSGEACKCDEALAACAEQCGRTIDVTTCAEACSAGCVQQNDLCTGDTCACDASLVACQDSCGVSVAPRDECQPSCVDQCLTELDSCEAWGNDSCRCRQWFVECANACGESLSKPRCKPGGTLPR